MSNYDEQEGVNVIHSDLTTFYNDFRMQLKLMTGLIELPKDCGLTLEDVRRPKLVLGKPGIGKTMGIAGIIKELNLVLDAEHQIGFKKILLGQTVVGALSGIPTVNPATGKVMISQMPDLPDEERDGKYGVLFLDEITTADESQIQPALGLADDTRSIGTYTLPENWVVVGAGNGPDCANFVKLDDMTLTRFLAYDIDYDYKVDWRGFAHKINIDDLIIAFLNFKPTAVADVVSTEMDKAGKMFACPRTWTRLDKELKIRALNGRPVSDNEMFAFASRIIGTKASREFAAFAAFKTKVVYDAEKIIAGTEKEAKMMTMEAFHILMQTIISHLRPILEAGYMGKDEYGGNSYTAEAATAVGNAVDWILGLSDSMLECVINAIVELRVDIKGIPDIISDSSFSAFCPRFDNFLAEHAELIMSVDINSLS